MAQPDDGRGNLYEQVLEYAKREMDEAASKMDEIKQSLELLEARVEAAKAVYQAVASRLNLEDEADGPGFQASFPEVPAHVPEPPVSENGSSSPDLENPISDLDLIRQHLAGKAQANEMSEPPTPAPAAPTPAPAAPMATPAEPVSAPVEPAPEAEAPAPVPGTPPMAKPPTAAEDDSLSMKLIRQHLEQKAKEQGTPPDAPAALHSAPVEPAPLQMAAIVQDAPSAPEEPAAGGSGLSEADRELIGVYLRSKQN